MLIDGFEQAYQLGQAQMDATHREFVDLVNGLEQAQGAAFAAGFAALVSHTRAHFAAELDLMQRSGFPATAEHDAEHRRVLGQLERFAQRVDRGSQLMARAYVRDEVPGWFKLHAITMDSALAAHLARSTGDRAAGVAVAPPAKPAADPGPGRH